MSIFSEVQKDNVQYSTFDLSHQHKLTMNAGELVPSLFLETVPSDVFDVRINQLMRMQPLLAPIMHQVTCTHHAFWVPLRIVWNDSKYSKFITGGEAGMTEIAFPTIKNVPASSTSVESYKRNKLANYLGLPLVQGGGVNAVYDEINPFPFLAYQLIYKEYYRDQNVEQDIVQGVRWDDEDLWDITSWIGYPMLDYNNLPPEQQALFTRLQKRAWQHDYFTSALPWPQKGEPVTLNIGESAPVILNIDKNAIPNSIIGNQSVNNRTLQQSDNVPLQSDSFGILSDGNNTTQVFINPGETLIADLSQASAATIIELRKAVVLQQWLEKRARTGSRIVEYLQADFKVRSSDGRFQRPEFCGGSSTPVLISETLQTSATENSSTPLGEMAGHGISMGGSYISSKYCEEHGFYFTLTTVMPKTGYHQGMPKIWKKFDKFDYVTPIMQNVGEQEITQGELYYQAQPTEDNKVYGYGPRYIEYKYQNNRVSGDFANTLDYWTWDRKFDEAPTLSKEFIQCNPRRDIFAITDEKEDTLLMQIYYDIKRRAPLSYWSSPGLERL